MSYNTYVTNKKVTTNQRVQFHGVWVLSMEEVGVPRTSHPHPLTKHHPGHVSPGINSTFFLHQSFTLHAFLCHPPGRSYRYTRPSELRIPEQSHWQKQQSETGEGSELKKKHTPKHVQSSKTWSLTCWSSVSFMTNSSIS